jgi:hypothetical protein
MRVSNCTFEKRKKKSEKKWIKYFYYRFQ